MTFKSVVINKIRPEFGQTMVIPDFFDIERVGKEHIGFVN